MSLSYYLGYITNFIFKFKTNKVADNVSMLVANIKTLYAQQNTYERLNNITAYSMGVVPDELKGTHTAAQGAEGKPNTEGYIAMCSIVIASATKQSGNLAMCWKG